jgi:hypothetical protein
MVVKQQINNHQGWQNKSLKKDIKKLVVENLTMKK